MAYLTERYLASLAPPITVGGIDEFVGVGEVPRSPDVFLSHSSLDRDPVAGAVTYLTDRGASVYVDYEDSRLPTQPSAQTAAELRERIRAARRMIVATSRNLKQSRWIPWELGFADGAMGVNGYLRIALMPLAPNVGALSIEQEYLDAYPWIEELPIADGSLRSFVMDPRRRACWPFEHWLRFDVT